MLHRYFLIALLALQLAVVPAIAQDMAHPHDHEDIVVEAEEGIQYVCPMHSHIVRDEPGNCPICGMDLEPQVMVEEIRVEVSGQMQQNLGITTAVVNYDTLWRYYPTIATVQWNDNARIHVHPRASGWLETLNVRSVGERVNQGDKVFEIYSRELVVAQQDFLQTLDALSAFSNIQRERLIRDGKLRLKLLGMNDAQIKTLQETKELMYQVAVFAPQSGTVTELGVAEGMYVEPGTQVMTITADNSMWLIADVPERYSNWLQVEAPADVTLAEAGLHDYETRVDYIYPELDPVARTQRVRIKLPKTSDQSNLLVGMQANVALYGGPKREVLTVPLESLIIVGEKNRVIVQRPDQSFEQRDVHVGLIVGDQAEVLHGLSAGETVVTSGQFLLDSEASLRGSRLRQPQPAGDGHAH
ncbi:efflux RND transporter periplasmic adaptor subunit [Pseudidiomarina sp.]|uniref:efflux RND transporter periplasmic adaptor subunit n=1 Tax=Pseudidiomarina sp. TaxID=2081707 RepID=UPI00299EC967|nr:efflux RND transporter periplasmic adaptor subunit [Pseudidiomarina sp.]MDX1705259.1 efflux RND transporter periplasmic adaptor subunit [Pseudidiomarina sp.]